MPQENQQSTRIEIIKAVQTPLGFFALVVLVVEIILGVLVGRARGFDFTLLLIGMISILILIVSIVAYLTYKSPKTLIGENEQIEKKHKYDMFIASPMAAWNSPEQYKRDRGNVMRIVETLRQECNLQTIYYMGQDIKSVDKFDTPDVGVKQDLEILRDSKYFILLYPEKIVSSVLVEAGWALALRKESIYFVRDRADLPFLLRQVAQAFSTVRIYEVYNSPDEIIKLIKRRKERLFASPTKNSISETFLETSTTFKTESKTNLISLIQSPLRLLALIVLIIEIILGILATTANNTDFTILAGSMIVLLLTLISIVGFLAYKSPKSLLINIRSKQEQIKPTFRHDVYIASPMAAWKTNEEYEQDRGNVLRIVEALQVNCKFKSIFYMGREIKTMSDFDAPDVGTTDNLKALEGSQHFILLYPEKLVSSVLVETGWALALGKVSVYFVQNRDDLPFLLRQTEQAFPSVKIYDGYQSVDEVVRLIQKYKERLFEIKSIN